MERRIRILSTGSYVPKTQVLSSEIDRKLGMKDGWTQRVFGIAKRHYADEEETTSFMAARAAIVALDRAGLKPSDLSCIISACGVGEQPIPCTAALVQNKLGLGSSGIAAFDVNATCLSFVTALDVAADAISAGRYETVLIASADIASCGLDWSNPEAAAIFGDGAAAAIIIKSGPGDGSRLIASRMETYSNYQDVCRLEAGGTRVRADRDTEAFWERTTFKMDGRAALGCVLKHLPEFLHRLYTSAGLSNSDLEVFVLHQASHHSLMAVQKHMGFDPGKMEHIFRDFGNQIASSIPHALDHAITCGRMKRGDKVILLGTSGRNFIRGGDP